MLFLNSNIRIWLCTAPTDMRRSYPGLIALVKNHLAHNPLSGELFVFINRKRTHMKVLYFEAGGFCIWGKRLEQGSFAAPRSAQVCESVSWAQLNCLIDGVELHVIKQRLRYPHSG